MFRALLLALTLFSASALAATPSCDTPQDAARSLLDWLQPDNWHPDEAAACLELPADMQARAPEVAVELKKVLDARGMYVPTDRLSLDPGYVDAEGRAQLVPIPTHPELVLVKRGDRWLYSADFVGQADAMYDATFSGIAGKVQGWIPASVQGELLGLQTWQYVYALLLVMVSLLAGLVAQKLLADQFIRIARKLKVQLSIKVIRGTRLPLTWFATGIVFRLGVPDLQLGIRASQVLLLLADVVISGTVVLMAARLVDVGAEVFAKRAALTESKMDDQVIPLASRALKGAIWILGIVFVVQNMGVDVGSLLAGLGIGGLAFALAAKDTVENLFGSLTIFTDRPFQIGDWVVIGGGTEGVVEEVGFRTTRVRTFYNSVVAVPNGKVANSPIDNMGRRDFRRVTTTLGLTYDTPRDTLDAYVKALQQTLKDNPEVAQDATQELHFKDFGASALEIMVYFFLDVPDWHRELEVRSQIFSEFMRLAEEHGVRFAYPTQTLHIESAPAGFVPR